MKLRATPGSGQEWLVWDEDDLQVATFHGYKMGSDRPQKLAEGFVLFSNLAPDIEEAAHQMRSGYNVNAGN